MNTSEILSHVDHTLSLIHIFLYCDITELWGHVWKAQPGNGIPGQAR